MSTRLRSLIGRAIPYRAYLQPPQQCVGGAAAASRQRLLSSSSITPQASSSASSFFSSMAIPSSPSQTRVEHVIQQKYRHPIALEEGLEAKFAVINIKSKQYKITKDDVVVSDKIEGLEPGTLLDIDEVHLVGTPDYTLVGRPFVKNAKVQLQVEEQAKDAKVIVFKKKRRKNYRRKQGFRREVTILRVLDIQD